MAPYSPRSSLLRRAATGVIAGAIIGFLIEPLCFWGEHPGDDQIRLPVLGPIIGAGICAVLAAWFGNISFDTKTERITIHVLLGIIAGILLGASIFPAILTACDAIAIGTRHSKVFGGYQQLGILIGIPLGASLGFAVALFRKRH